MLIFLHEQKNLILKIILIFIIYVRQQAIINYYAKQSHEQRRVMHFHGLLLKNVGKCSLRLYNTVLGSFAKGEMSSEARALYNSMPERDMYSHNTLLLAYARAGELDACQTLLREMPTKDLVSHNTYLNGCARSGDVDRTFDAFGALQSEGFTPDIVSLNAIIIAYSKAGKPDSAAEWLSSMPEKFGLEPSEESYSCLIDGFAQRSDLSSAQDWLSKMEDQAVLVPTTHTWNSMIVAAAKSASKNGEKSVCQAAREYFDKIESPSLVNYNTMIQFSDSKTALAFLEAMVEREIAPNSVTYTNLTTIFDGNLPASVSNHMNRYGVILNEIGMYPLMTAIQQLIAGTGVAEKAFGGIGATWDGHHSFIVQYSPDKDTHLDMHTDDSDVTLNICLGIDFEGSQVAFCGKMGAPNHRKEQYVYPQQKGRCLIHLGRQRHGAVDITKGERMNLIIWNKSSSWRRTQAYPHNDYYVEEAKPDPVCLSYTHDRDFLVYKDIPKGAEKMERRKWCPPRGREYEGFVAK